MLLATWGGGAQYFGFCGASGRGDLSVCADRAGAEEVHRQQGDAGGKAGREAHPGRDAEGPPHPLPDDAGGSRLRRLA